MSYFNFTSDIDSTYIDNITPLYDNKILKLFRVLRNNKFKGVTMNKKKLLSGLSLVVVIAVAFSLFACKEVQEPPEVNEDDNVPRGLTATFGQELSAIVLPQDWEWLNPTDLVGNAGRRVHSAIYTIEDEIHQLVILVDRAVPVDYIVPGDLTAKAGESLSEIILPLGWEWNNPQEKVGDVGIRLHTATYTPTDSLNYNSVIYPLPVLVIEPLQPGVFSPALNAVPVSLTMQGEAPRVIDTFADGARLHFLVEAGQINHMYIGDMVRFNYSGFGGMSQSVTDITIQTFEKSTTETVSNSFTFTNESGGSNSIATTVGGQLGTPSNNFQFSVSLSRSWNWSASHSQSGEKSFTTSLTEANSFAREVSNTLSVTSGDPMGEYRIALYSTGQVYFFITTCLMQEIVYEWDTVVTASDFSVRQEYCPNNNFDNSPTGNKIDFPYEFIGMLKMEEGDTVDYSNIPTGQLNGHTYTIPNTVQRITFIGQFDRGVSFNNFQIIVAQRTSSLFIAFENFGMQSNAVGITSSSPAVIVLSLRGNNRIVGGNGATVSGAGSRGQDGYPAIITNGNLTLTGGGSIELIGGNGSAGLQGISYVIDARAGVARGRDGGVGGQGGNGGNGIEVQGLNIIGGVENIIVRGGNGANGGRGGNGEGTHGPGNAQAGHGGLGGNGGDGGTGIVLRNSILSLDLLLLRSLQIFGGNSGNAGRGGDGGRGHRSGDHISGSIPDHGGNGGDGGNGGRGGIGINFVNHISHVLYKLPTGSITSIVGGRGGNGASGGTGGDALRNNHQPNGINGSGGLGGNGGNGGLAVRATNITDVMALFNVSLTSQGGTRGANGANGSSSGNNPSSPPNGRTPQPTNGAIGQRVGS
jgi:hypothetical protein